MSVELSSSPSPSVAAPAAEPAKKSCVFSGVCDWFKTKECAAKALVCLATAFVAASTLPLWATAASFAVGVGSTYAVKEKYSVLNDVGSSITHQDLARQVVTLAAAFFAPSLALYALSLNLAYAGNVFGRVFKA